MKRAVKHLDWQEQMISGPVVSRQPAPVKIGSPSLPIVAMEGGLGNVRLSPRGKRAADRWFNYLSSFGSFGSDPMASTFFGQGEKLTQQTLEYMYEHDWMCRKMIESLPDAGTRKGFEINVKTKEGKDPLKKHLKQRDVLLRQLDDWESLKKSRHLNYQARLYGGAAKLYFTEDAYNQSKYPLVLPTVRKLAKTSIIHAFYCQPKFFYTNYNDLERFKDPQVYRIQEHSIAGMIPIYDMHHTRMVRVDGAYLPDHLKIKNWGWGNSVLQVAFEAIRSLGVAFQSLGAIIQDFVTKVLKLDNFEDLLEDNEEELNYRISQADGKSNIHNISVIGPNETLEKIAVPIQNLADIVIILMDVVAGATDTPKSEYYGHASGNLGSSSGKFDRDNRSDKIETFQDEKLILPLKKDLEIACAIHHFDINNFEIAFNSVRDKEEKTEAETWLLEERAKHTAAQRKQIVFTLESGNQDQNGNDNDNFKNRNKGEGTERSSGRHNLNKEYETETD